MSGRDQQQPRGDQGEQGQQPVHAEHLGQGHDCQQQGVKEHHNAPGKTLRDRVQVVGVEAHKAAHLVDLVIVLAQTPGIVEHPVADVLLHLEGGAQEHDAPQEAADDHGQDDGQHGHADPVQQEVHVKGHHDPVHQDLAVVDAVDDHLVELGDQQLQIVHRRQGGQSDQQHVQVAEVVAVDVFPEYHTASLLVGTQNAKCKVQSAKCKVQNAK